MATLGWVRWHNTERLHGYLEDVPPAEFEAPYAAQQTDHLMVGIQQHPSRHQTQSDSPTNSGRYDRAGTL